MSTANTKRLWHMLQPRGVYNYELYTGDRLLLSAGESVRIRMAFSKKSDDTFVQEIHNKNLEGSYFIGAMQTNC